MWKRRLLFLWVVGLLLLGCEGERAVRTEGMAEIPVSYVALTFDDGPHMGTTDRLLDGLLQRGASATFFLVGEEAEANPQLVCRMRAEGHQIGNHTWSHVRLEGPEAVTEEVGRTETLLESLAGGSGYWLRPPYGQIADGTETKIKVPMVTWSVDPRDWESRDTEKVVQAVLADVKPNSIILLHDIYPTSVDAALRIVDTLQGEGYCFVTVEELLRLNGITPQAGTIYRSGEAQ
jgi:peptidoglycan/xylan/chitin deacetylase (PgdA/CDA1 family)